MRNQIDALHSYLNKEIPDFRTYADNYLATNVADEQDRKIIEKVLTCLENTEFKCRYLPNESDKIYNVILMMLVHIAKDVLQNMLIEELADV